MTAAPLQSGADGSAEPVLVVDTPLPGVRRLTLNRPASLNAISRELVGRLVDELQRTEDDHEVRVLVIAAAVMALAWCTASALARARQSRSPRLSIRSASIPER